MRLNVIDDDGDKGLCEFYPQNALIATLFNTIICLKQFWHSIFISINFDMLNLEINSCVHWILIIISYVFC